jgi:hypothetical protein
MLEKDLEDERRKKAETEKAKKKADMKLQD